MMRLQSYLSGRWQDGSGPGAGLFDPVTGAELARASGDGLDLGQALGFARDKGGPALKAMTFAQRGQLLAAIAGVLAENKDRYYEITLKNSGTGRGDAVLDIDGGIATLKYYAGLSRGLGEKTLLAEAGSDQFSKDESFRAGHIWTPLRGVAVHINAFNFPSWGLWEKAAVSLLAGVPFLSKPATATAWLAYEMVKDVVAKAVLPEGALSLLCGGGRDLMDRLAPGDLVSFTGSADTALNLRSNRNALAANVRFSVEADSLNLACLGPDAEAGSEIFAAFIKTVVQELTVKAGQKCTAIRRILVPRARLAAVDEALEAQLAAVTVGDPRDPATRMGPLVNKAQQAAAWSGIEKLATEARMTFGGQRDFVPAGLDPAKACFVPLTLLCHNRPLDGHAVHEVEVFGPVATLLPYDNEAEAVAIARAGGGSLAGSIYSDDDAFALSYAGAVASAHGRLQVIDSAIAKTNPGHGVVMPQSIHGGPGRAGGGEELGGLRGLRFYMQRTALQISRSRLEALAGQAAEVAL